jgi:cytochrome c-type biogenesis protein CcmH/NrfG
LDGQALTNLGIALAQTGQPEAAIKEFRAAVAAQPANAEAHGNLGRALMTVGRMDEAVAEYRETLRLRPEGEKILTTYARILALHPDAKYRDGPQAVILAERACTLTGSLDTLALSVLAGAYAEVGRFADAVLVADRAATVAERKGQLGWRDKMQSRVEAYKAGRQVFESMQEMLQNAAGTSR